MTPETLRLCQQVIRLAKGILKACEEWLHDTVKRGNGENSA